MWEITRSSILFNLIKPSGLSNSKFHGATGIRVLSWACPEPSAIRMFCKVPVQDLHSFIHGFATLEHFKQAFRSWNLKRTQDDWALARDFTKCCCCRCHSCMQPREGSSNCCHQLRGRIVLDLLCGIRRRGREAWFMTCVDQGWGIAILWWGWGTMAFSIQRVQLLEVSLALVELCAAWSTDMGIRAFSLVAKPAKINSGVSVSHGSFPK